MFRRFLNLRNRTAHRPLTRYGRGRLQILDLDDKCLPSGGVVSVLELEPNDTMDVSQRVIVPAAGEKLEVTGNIGNGAMAASDVDWYSFKLETAATVRLAITSPDGQTRPVLGIYQSRMLAQNGGSGPTGMITRNLAPGTYYVAVSGAGNLDFNPHLAGSGYPGLTGDYVLGVEADPIVRPVSSGPVVINLDSRIPGVSNASPSTLKLQTNAALDESSLVAGTNILLTFNPTGDFGNANDEPVTLVSAAYDASNFELCLTPENPLGKGFYSLRILGDTTTTSQPVLGENQLPLGYGSSHRNGRNDVRTFQVVGAEGEGGNDTAATSIDLGRLKDGSFVRKTGVIGDDPSAFNALLGSPSTANPGAGVDMYRFQIKGAGRFALTAEVFSGRIGSDIDSGLSLFRKDTQTGLLVLVNSNNNSLNQTISSIGTLPLFTDPVLMSGLQAGEYYIAVSSDANTPGFAVGSRPGENGIFDPNISRSGLNGSSVGRYSLNIQLERDDVAPRVLATSPAPGQVLGLAPEKITVRFSEAIDFQKYLEQGAGSSGSPEVHIQAADGTRIIPRLLSYNPITSEATFQMLDGLSNGSYRLCFAGTGGLTDLAGNAILGNSPSGDFVTPFSVNDPVRGSLANPLVRTAVAGDAGTPQNLGVMFPRELQSNVVLQKTASAGTFANAYRFRILQSQTYCFDLAGENLPDTARLTLTALNGDTVALLSPSNRTLFGMLASGEYLIRVDGSGESGSIEYQLKFKLVASEDNPPPLSLGTSPAIRYRIAGDTTDPVVVSPASVPSRATTTMALLSAGPVGGVNVPISGSDDQLAAKPVMAPQPLTVASILTTTLLESPRVIPGDETATTLNASIADLPGVSRFSSRLADSVRRVGSQVVQLTRYLADLRTPAPAETIETQPLAILNPTEISADADETLEPAAGEEIPAVTTTRPATTPGSKAVTAPPRVIGGESDPNEKPRVFMKLAGLMTLSGVWLRTSFFKGRPAGQRRTPSLEKSPKGVTL